MLWTSARWLCARRFLTAVNELYNEALSSAERTFDCAIGIEYYPIRTVPYNLSCRNLLDIIIFVGASEVRGI